MHHRPFIPSHVRPPVMQTHPWGGWRHGVLPGGSGSISLCLSKQLDLGSLGLLRGP